MSEDRAQPGAPPPILQRRLTFLLHRVASAAGADANAALAPLGFDVRHYALLAAVEAVDGPSQRELADAVAIDRATVVGLLDDLDRLGLVRRARSESDRRANAVLLTATGRQRLKRAHALMEDCEADFVASLTPGQRERLRDLLAGLVERP